MFGNQKKQLDKIEELLREIQLSNEHLAGNRPFEPPPGYAWGTQTCLRYGKVNRLNHLCRLSEAASMNHKSNQQYAAR